MRVLTAERILRAFAAASRALLLASTLACVSKVPEIGGKGEHGRLLWADEFETPGRPDPSRWNVIQGGNGWNDDELQYYVDAPETAGISDGFLRLRALRERTRGRDYASARIDTAGLGAWRYGRVELRAKLPAGDGLYAYARLLPAAGDEDWPATGEIIFMDHLGIEPNFMRASLHDEGRNALRRNERTVSVVVEDCASAFHVYAVERRPGGIAFYVDGTRYWSVDRPKAPNRRKKEDDEAPAERPWPFDGDFRLVLGLAVGGALSGREGVDTGAFPAEIEIDWVRVWDLGIRK